MSLPRVTVSDLIDFAPSKRTITPEGYLTAPAKISRTGIQVYTARELGLDGGDNPVRLYRPPSEVFSRDSLASFEGRPITNDHPPDDVSAATWSGVAVGDFHDVARADDTHVGARLIVRDLNAVQDVQAGKSELSCGYSFALDMTPGTTPEGEAYDGIQRDIIGNHLAIVRAGRAGSQVRIADSTNERTTMGSTIEAEFLAQGEAWEREKQRQIAAFSMSAARATDADGDGISVRDTHFAREAALSRRPAGSRRTEEPIDDDDGPAMFAGMTSRDAWIARDAARSRGQL